jgi:hypothetical protein
MAGVWVRLQFGAGSKEKADPPALRKDNNKNAKAKTTPKLLEFGDQEA